MRLNWVYPRTITRRPYKKSVRSTFPVILDRPLFYVGTDGNWTGSTNWSYYSGGTGGGGPPNSDQVAIFDSNSGNCTLDANATCLSLVIGTSGSAYTGTLDLNDFDLDVGSEGVDCTDGGSATIVGGSGTWLCDGDFDIEDIGTFTYGTSTISLSGNSVTLTADLDSDINNLVIQSGAFVTLAGSTRLDTHGTCTIAGGLVLDIILRCNQSSVALGISGAIVAGASTLECLDGAVVTGTPSSWSPGLTQFAQDVTFNSTGTFGGDFLFDITSGTRSVTFAAGDRTFTGNVEYRSDSGTSYTVDYTAMGAGNTTTYEGNVDFTQTAGSLVYSKGTGTNIFGGASDQVITTPGLWTDILEDIEINKTNATDKVTLAGDVYTETFTGTQGRFDLDGNTLFSDGNVDIDTSGGFQFHNGTDNNMNSGVIDLDGGALTLDGTVTTDLEINNLDFNLASGVAGTATYSNVTNSLVTYITSEIDATDASNTNSGGNTGWDFGGGGGLSLIIAAYHYNYSLG